MNILNDKQLKSTLSGLLSPWEIATIFANRKLVESKDTREIGKSRQHAAEDLVIDWMNSLSLGLNILSQKELEEAAIDGKLPEDFNYDHNESGFDAMCLNTGARIQIKYRGGQSIHMEQTRRSSEKNKGVASKTGHVVYSQGEFDILVAVRPEEISMEFDPNKDLMIFSEKNLRDHANPGFLVRSISKKTEASLREEMKSSGTINVLNNILKEFKKGE